MEPTIRKGDLLMVDYKYYADHAIKDGDIIVFRHNDFTLVKRVSAIAGESIEGRDGVFVRNGHALNEPYANHSGHPPPEAQDFGLRTVANGEVFVTGDNRDESLDSRMEEFGSVKTSDVLGAALTARSSKLGPDRKLLQPDPR